MRWTSSAAAAAAVNALCKEITEVYGVLQDISEDTHGDSDTIDLELLIYYR